MVTWQENAPHSRPDRPQHTSMSASAIPRHQELDDPGALHETSEHIQQAETALTPGTLRPADSDVDRLLADQLMVDAILEQGLGGPRHQALEDALIRYAVPVLRKLLASGEIIAKAARLGRPVSESAAWLEFTPADREEFALDMVADALPVFTKAVFGQRRWSPARGASLKTYFVNACIRQFSRPYRAWLDQRRVVQPAGLDIAADSSHEPDPAIAVAVRDEASRLLNKIPDRQTQEVLALRATGWSARDAAHEVGLTEKAAENRLARIRKTLKEERNNSEPPTGNETPCSMKGGSPNDAQEAR
jgi:DNA-directed RNA polymerase specialized sigma24 family protein